MNSQELQLLADRAKEIRGDGLMNVAGILSLLEARINVVKDAGRMVAKIPTGEGVIDLETYCKSLEGDLIRWSDQMTGFLDIARALLGILEKK